LRLSTVRFVEAVPGACYSDYACRVWLPQSCPRSIARSGSATVPGPETAVVDVVFQERYWYPDDGGVVWMSGYQVVEAGTGRYLARDAPELAARGVHVSAVAGAQFNEAVLASDGAAPGRPLTLRRDAGNEHDANAVAVHVGDGEQLGWVPRELAAEVAPELDAGAAWSAVALRERRASPRDPRTGLTMLLARAPSIELREHDARPPRPAPRR
jgi:hypothetical protein